MAPIQTLQVIRSVSVILLLVTSAVQGWSVDFSQHIGPVLKARCVECHGPSLQEGGLRLDRQEAFLRGGKSGKPIRGEGGELMRRILLPAEDPEAMPPEGARLPVITQEHFREWMGGEFRFESLYPEPDYEKLLYPKSRLLRIGFAWGSLIPLFFALCWFWKRSWKGWVYRVPWILFPVILAASWHCLLAVKLDRDRAFYVLASPTHRIGGYLYGGQPLAVFLDEDQALSRQYYRGNCERSPELWNGGHYQTASFRLWLESGTRKPLAAGDPWPESSQIVLEIHRAPGTYEPFYREDVLANVFVTTNRYHDFHSPLKQDLVFLETQEPGQVWRFTLPLKARESQEDHRFFVYYRKGIQALRTGDDVRAWPRWEIELQLLKEGDTISGKSNLRMGNLLWNRNFKFPEQPGLMTTREWFDSSPIPVIQGTNTSDPALLGVHEYLTK